MKRIFLFIAIILYGMSVAARDTTAHLYQSIFGENSTVWTILSGDEGAGSTAQWTTTGSSIIEDGLAYRTIRFVDWSCSCDGWEENEYAYPQYIRESPDHAQLYLRSNVVDYAGMETIALPEILLMDLNLNVGDTLDTRGWSNLLPEWFFGYDNSPIPVITVDTVYHAGGSKMVRTDYVRGQNHTGYDTLSFIEGVGPSMGLFYPRKYYPHILMCSHKDDTLVFCKYPFLGCEGWWVTDDWPVGINDGVIDNVKIYPNPTDGIVYFEMPPCQMFTLRLVSVLGKTVYCQHLTTNCADISHIPSGIYFVSIETDDDMYTSKIIKK